jgi:hypothetical protein
MAPPANTTFATAVTISSFPFTLTQSDINDAGTNYTVYYRFIAPADAKVIGAWGFSGNIGAGYRPTLKPYNGPAGAPTQILSIAGQNLRILFPVVAGNEYFLEFLKNANSAGPEHIDINVQVAPDSSVVVGDIAVNDDVAGLPTIIESSLTNFQTRRYFLNTASSDEGNILYPSREIMLTETIVLTDSLFLYDYNFNLLQSYPALSSNGVDHVSANHGSNKWYIGNGGGGPDNVRYATIANRVMSSTVDIGVGAGLTCLAANNDDTILYFAGFGGSVNTPVKRWNIPGAVALTDFATGLANYQNEDIIVLADDTILISYFKSSVARDFFVRRYNAAGTILNTYNFGSVTFSTPPKIARALDNPNSFWAWTANTSGGNLISTFTNVKVSDGSILHTVTHGMYTSGIYNGNETATPVAPFGNSDSCTFFIMDAVDIGGLYYINKNITHDIYYTADKKIPDPTIRTALVGE